jgi:hypothetical protein
LALLKTILIIYQLVNDKPTIETVSVCTSFFLIKFTVYSTKQSSKSAIATYLQKSWMFPNYSKIDAFNKYDFKCY